MLTDLHISLNQVLTRSQLKVSQLDRIIERTLTDMPVQEGMPCVDPKIHHFGEGQAFFSKNYSIVYKTFLTVNENDKDDLELLLQNMNAE